MNRNFLLSAVLAFALTATATAHESGIDDRSYQLGIIGAFSEVVRLGVKTIALSEVMSPDEMDDMMDDIAVIAERNEVQTWRETDFLVTDLYPANVAEGRHVVLIYTGDTLERYLAIKADKAALQAAGRYEGPAREEIARRFGRLLSYPEPVIDDLLAREKLLEN